MMVRTKQCVTRQYVEEVLVEEGSSFDGEEMEMPSVAGSSGESMAEDTSAEEEASRRHGRKLSEGRVSFKNPFLLFN